MGSSKESNWPQKSIADRIPANLKLFDHKNPVENAFAASEAINRLYHQYVNNDNDSKSMPLSPSCIQP
jgi:hypothetical protein